MRRGFFDKPAPKPAAKPAAAAPKPTPAAPSSGSLPSSAQPSTSSTPIERNKLGHSVVFPTDPINAEIPFWSFLSADRTQPEPNASCALHLVPSSAALARQTIPWIQSGGTALMPPLPTSNLAEGKANYEIRSIPGKGLGMVALRPLPQDVLVFQDRPLLVYEPDRIPHHHHQAVLQHALSYLLREKQEEFLALSTCFAGPEAAIKGRVETNAFSCITIPGEQVSYSGVFPVLSRVNHSCDANTLLDFDPSGFVVGLRTTRMIKIGEEITFCYIIPFQKRRERKEELMIKYRFDCQCGWCSLSDEASAEKDKEREHMAKLFLDEMQVIAPSL